MIDIVDKKTRSRMMSNIRSENTKPEIVTRGILHRLGYRFRLNSKVDNIKPDIVLRSRKVAIFVHGCFWHQHRNCKLAYSDRNYSAAWQKKFRQNLERDLRAEKYLKEQGWRVAVVWECEARKEVSFEKKIHDLDRWICKEDSNFYTTDR
jgi:DNA mismatch endonuclease, patch repair protein